MQRCSSCSGYRYPPSPICPDCGGSACSWAPLTGRGRVLSWVVFHQVYYPEYDLDVPYAVVLVRLEEGPKMISNVTADFADLEIGLPVEVAFRPLADGIALPYFRPAATAAASI